MCLSCQYLPPADELNLQLALSVTGNCVRTYIYIHVCVRVWVSMTGVECGRGLWAAIQHDILFAGKSWEN